MSSASSPTLICDVSSRRAERWVARLALAAAAIVPFLIPTPVPGARIALLGACVVLVCSGLWRAGWLGGGRRIFALCWRHDGQWLLVDERGKSVEGALRSDCRAGSGWAWLRWRTSDRLGGGRSMLLLAGDLPAGQLRRLVVRLRIEGGRASGPDRSAGRGHEVPPAGRPVS